MHYISDNNERLYLFPYSHCLYFGVGHLLVSVEEAKWMHTLSAAIIKEDENKENEP
jgi:hypothetical protein